MRLFLLIVLLSISNSALADHPGERLNEVMAAKEAAFEPFDGPAPELPLREADGGKLDLADFEDKIVVLSFVPEDCGSPCADQQQLLVQVQRDVNVGPMRDMVTFVTVAGPTRLLPRQWNSSNWIPAVTSSGPVGQEASRMAATSGRDQKAPMVHVLQRGGRQAAIFHGAEFRPTNMLLYINGLTNAHPREPGRLDWLFGWFP